jgi:hypothetical protein
VIPDEKGLALPVITLAVLCQWNCIERAVDELTPLSLKSIITQAGKI